MDDQRKEPGLPQDILDAISNCLSDSPQELVGVMMFLANERDPTNYIRIFKSVMANDQVFREILKNLAKDAEKLVKNPEFQRIMADIWNDYLEPSTKSNIGHGQRINYLEILKKKDQFHTVTTFNFLQALSTIPPSAQAQMIRSAANAAEMILGGSMAVAVRQSANTALQLAKSTSGKLVTVGLVAVYLSYEVMQSLHRWWKGEITGVRCAKNIIDSCVGLAAGVGGGFAGAAIGTAISPGLGTIIGGVVGGVISSTVASTFSDWATQKIFNLPKEEALENAYRFLGLSYGASNNEINSCFRLLALEYHPDKGGSYEDWHKLQLSLGLIKISKGEI